jgi:hypothetical protein
MCPSALSGFRIRKATLDLIGPISAGGEDGRQLVAPALAPLAAGRVGGRWSRGAMPSRARPGSRGARTQGSGGLIEEAEEDQTDGRARENASAEAIAFHRSALRI